MILAFFIYTFLFLFTLTFSYLGTKSKNTMIKFQAPTSWHYWSVAIIVYTFIVGLRENVGIDYYTYRSIFEELIRFGESAKRMDLIFYFFIPIVKYIHYNIFISFLAFITIFFLFKCFENNKNILVYYIFFYFTLLTFFTTLNTMRVHAVFFIFFYATNQFLEKNYKRFIVCLIFAVTIHLSVIFILPLIFFFKYDFLKSRLLQYLLLFLAFFYGNVIFFKLEPFIENLSHFHFIDQYAVYFIRWKFWIQRAIESKNSNPGWGLYPYFIFFIDCIVIYYSQKLKEVMSSKHFTVFYNFFIFGAIISNIFAYSEAINRLVAYFTFYRIYIYSEFFFFVFSNKTIEDFNIFLSFICISIFFVCIVFFFITIYRGPMLISPFYFISFK